MFLLIVMVLVFLMVTMVLMFFLTIVFLVFLLIAILLAFLLSPYFNVLFNQCGFMFFFIIMALCSF